MIRSREGILSSRKLAPFAEGYYLRISLRPQYQKSYSAEGYSGIILPRGQISFFLSRIEGGIGITFSIIGGAADL